MRLFRFGVTTIDRSTAAGALLLLSLGGFVQWAWLLLGNHPAHAVLSRVWPWLAGFQLVNLVLALLLRGRLGSRSFRTRSGLAKQFGLVGDEYVLCLDHQPLQVSEAIASHLSSGRVTDMVVWDGLHGARDWSHARAMRESQRFSGRLEFQFQKGKELPAYDDSLDVVYLAGMQDLSADDTLVEVHRVLKPGGRLFLAGTFWTPQLRRQLARCGLSISQSRPFLTEARKPGSAPRGLRPPVHIDVTFLPAAEETNDGSSVEA